MGCPCLKSTTSHELLIDEVFSSIQIRKVRIDIVLGNLDKHTNFADVPFIPETNFQVLMNTYLIPEDVTYRHHFFNYWTDFYRKKPYRLQQPLIKLCFALLSNSNVQKDSHFIEKIFKEYKQIKEKKEMAAEDTRMSLEDVFTVLKDYIFSITLLPVEHFKHFSPNPEDFCNYLQKLWDKDVIDMYIKKHFFYSDDTWLTKIHLKKFFHDNLDLLMDDYRLRRSLSEFSISITKIKKDKGEDYRDIFKRV
jgi:hypothetical protein